MGSSTDPRRSGDPRRSWARSAGIAVLMFATMFTVWWGAGELGIVNRQSVGDLLGLSAVWTLLVMASSLIQRCRRERG